jgi:hypothetical protein
VKEEHAAVNRDKLGISQGYGHSTIARTAWSYSYGRHIQQHTEYVVKEEHAAVNRDKLGIS